MESIYLCYPNRYNANVYLVRGEWSLPLLPSGQIYAMVQGNVVVPKSDDACYCKTFEDAIEELSEKAILDKIQAQKALDDAERFLERIKNLKCTDVIG